MDKNTVIAKIKSHRTLMVKLTRCYNLLNVHNKIRSRKYTLDMGVVYLNGLKIENRGTDNSIILEDFVRIRNSTIILHGNHNCVKVRQLATLNGVELYLEDDHNTIEIGEHTLMAGNAHLATLEGTRIIIGKDCLFSSDLHFRTGDSHSVLNLEGKRINPSMDILIGNHVWVGSKVTCLKNTTVADHCIIAATATLCNHYDTPHCVIGGVPAKLIKTDVDWDIRRLPVE